MKRSRIAFFSGRARGCFLLRSLFAILVLAAAAFGQTAGDWPQTESRLRTLLSGTSEQKRTALAEISGLRTEEASRLAVPALSDKDEIVRATAAASVIYLPREEAAAVLMRLLDDKQPFARRQAAYALGETGSAAATQKLINVMDNDRDREVRSAAAVALGDIGDDAALDALIQVLRERPTDDEEFLRRSAARSIGQIFDVLNGASSTRTVTPQNFLPSKFKDLGSGRAAPVLDARADAALAVLSRVLKNSKEAGDTRREAAFALGAVRSPSTAALLREYTNSPDPYLAEISREALLKIEKGQE